MKRALRRHHERVAKARRIRILLSHGAWVGANQDSSSRASHLARVRRRLDPLAGLQEAT